MKSKNLLVLTALLLTQTAPVWGMDNEQEEEKTHISQRPQKATTQRGQSYKEDAHLALALNIKDEGNQELYEFHLSLVPFGSSHEEHPEELREYYQRQQRIAAERINALDEEGLKNYYLELARSEEEKGNHDLAISYYAQAFSLEENTYESLDEERPRIEPLSRQNTPLHIEQPKNTSPIIRSGTVLSGQTISLKAENIALNSTRPISQQGFDLYEPTVNISHFPIQTRPLSPITADDVAGYFNQFAVNYIQNQGSQQIINYCIQKIDGYGKPLPLLREKFARMMKSLQTLSTESPEVFLNDVMKTFKNRIIFEEINRTVQTLDFLRAVNRKGPYSACEWKNALNNTLEKLRMLTIAPEISCENGFLALKGILIGMSDVCAALSQHPKSKNVNVFALNTLFFDQDIIYPSISFGFIAPQWKIIQNRTINLAGRSGMPGSNGVAPGLNGQSGGSGENGGHFFGEAGVIDSPHLLKVNTSGGNGGPGGHGANGVNGANGIDGADGLPGQNGGSGSAGSPGQDGGQAGAGGVGGHAGTITISPPLVPQNTISNAGAAGNPGIPGLGGHGGRGGRGGRGGQGQLGPNGYPSPDGMPGPDGPYGHKGLPGQVLNTIGLKTPLPQPPLNQDHLKQTYSVYYQGQAANPNVAPFIKALPNLQ
jgi:tetratricopeptide (TPR) repeat protein